MFCALRIVFSALQLCFVYRELKFVYENCVLCVENYVLCMQLSFVYWELNFVYGNWVTCVHLWATIQNQRSSAIQTWQPADSVWKSFPFRIVTLVLILMWLWKIRLSASSMSVKYLSPKGETKLKLEFYYSGKMRCMDNVKNTVSLRAYCTSFFKETQFPRTRCKVCLSVYMFACTDPLTMVWEIFNLFV